MKNLLKIPVLSFAITIGTLDVVQSQSFSFGTGPIPMGATTCFHAAVSGVGTINPISLGTGFYLEHITLDIKTDHPHTLVIWVTSPTNDSLLLSAYNGSNGQNYIACRFVNGPAPNIDGQLAPFTGSWEPEGGPLSFYDWVWGDGTWTICIKDTASPGSGSGGPGGGPWTPGSFGTNGNGGATMGFGSGALPVQLILFECEEEKEFNVVRWKTASEINNNYFDLERSFNGKDFTRITTIAGHGTTSQQHEYYFEDYEVNKLHYYYRLKQVDYNGDVAYSEIVHLKRKSSGEGFIHSIAPNPFGEKINISFTEKVEEEVVLELINLAGQKVYFSTALPNASEYTVDFSESSVSPGFYILKVTTQNSSFNYRMVKK